MILIGIVKSSKDQVFKTHILFFINIKWSFLAFQKRP